MTLIQHQDGCARLGDEPLKWTAHQGIPTTEANRDRIIRREKHRGFEVGADGWLVFHGAHPIGHIGGVPVVVWTRIRWEEQ